MTFAELDVPADLIAALAKRHITEPTAIQIAALPLLLRGSDVYLNSETGTGKTLAYLLPLFARLDTGVAATQVVVLAPTHELAIQIQRECCELAQHAGRPIRTLLLIGGTSMERQLDKLKARPHVVVGSPGRIRALVAMGKLKTQAIGCVVLDEVDRLMDAESLPDVQAVLQAAPGGRQLVFASATERTECTAALAALAPGLTVLRTGATPVNQDIEHLYLVCQERDKPELLRKLLHALRPERALVFAHQAATADRVAAQLAHHRIPAVELHATARKLDRKQAMDDFRSGRVRVMVASDVAARGLDLPGVTHVLNLDVPTLSQAYLHRVGRTGRAGAKGQAVTLLTEPEVRLVGRYQRELGIVMRRVRLREGQVIPAEAVDRPAGATPRGQRARPATKRA